MDSRIEKAGHCFEWADIKHGLEALEEVVNTEENNALAARTEYVGTCGKVFQAVSIAIPPAVREQ